MTTLHHRVEPVAPNKEEIELAREAGPRLASLAQKGRAIEVRVGSKGESCESLTVPASSLRLLADILVQMGEGHAVTVVPVETELTTQQAAELLNVSRPYLVKLLNEGHLPHRKVGAHHRVLLSDVLAYKKQEEAARNKVLDELAAQAQELNMGY